MTRPERDVPEWIARGACRHRPDVDFFADDAAAIARAKLVCESCPVRIECLQFACEHGEAGVWGGMTRRERRGLRARQSLGW
jgi:WhiB family redox-sensing transcriptional regulator